MQVLARSCSERRDASDDMMTIKFTTDAAVATVATMFAHPIKRTARRHTLAVAVLLLAVTRLSSAAGESAAEVIPPPTELPQKLSLDEALRMFKTRGLDLLIADANTRAAEGSVKIAGAVPNPVVSASVGNAFTYSTTSYSKTNCYQNGADCSPWIYSVGVNDSAAIEDTLSGKRNLRLRAARSALAAAKMSRRDAERTLVFQVKSAYVDVAQAALMNKFAIQMTATQGITLKQFRERYRRGAINEGDLQRIEVQKLEADRAMKQAAYTLRAARLALAFLLGLRGDIADFDVDTDVLAFSVPPSLRDVSGVDLLRIAFAHRPDLIGLGYLRQQAEAQLALVKRQRFPDINLGVNYAWGGYGGVSTNGPIQGPTLTFNLSAPLPVFYGLDGERRQAEAQHDASALQHAKATAQVVNDVSSSLAAYVAARETVELMEGARRDGGGELESARGAFEIVEVQYEKGAASLTDYLDALRTYIATKTEYFGDLANYRTAVYQLEAAVATELP
jgi:cobalt-zinc-cadmium efflux system outer membrane protein